MTDKMVKKIKKNILQKYSSEICSYVIGIYSRYQLQVVLEVSVSNLDTSQNSREHRDDSCWVQPDTLVDLETDDGEEVAEDDHDTEDAGDQGWDWPEDEELVIFSGIESNNSNEEPEDDEDDRGDLSDDDRMNINPGHAALHSWTSPEIHI